VLNEDEESAKALLSELLYIMLGIRKERIDPGQPWENYAETLFSIQRRLGDHAFSNGAATRLA
jgi:hypothetical protein